MSLSDALSGLAEKTSHKIPEIRERAIKALCGKILSPLVTDDHFQILSESPGFATSLLQWINERYDTCEYRLLLDVMATCQKMIERNEVLRVAFLDAGGIPFFDEFAIHNPALKNEVDRIIHVLLQGSSAQVSTTTHARPEVIHEQPNTFPSREAHPASNDDEQIMFDLAVRIKFATSTTSLTSIQETACSVIYALGPNLSPSSFIDFPVIVEAICGQLKMSNTINPITSECCDPLLTLIDKTIDRLVAQDHSIPLNWVAVVLSSLIESFGRRPEFIHRTAPIALKLLRSTPTDSSWSLAQLESIIRSSISSISVLFPPEKFFVERFDFSNSVTPVLLRKLHHPLTPQEFLVVQLVIEIVTLSTPLVDIVGLHPKAIDLMHFLSDLISDELFYQSSMHAKSLASKAAICIQDDSLHQARQLLLSVKKLEGEILTDSDFQNIFTIYLRVPQLLGHHDDPVEILALMIDQGEWRLVTDIMACDSGFADAMIDLVSNRKIGDLSPPPNWAMETIASSQSTRPRLFVEAISKLAGHQSVEKIFLPENDTGVSTESLVRSLFSTNRATRKQALVTLWHQQSSGQGLSDTESFFDYTENLVQKYLLKSSIEVERQELVNAIKLTLNPRLASEIRTASTTQACTLVVNSSWEKDCLNRIGLSDLLTEFVTPSSTPVDDSFFVAFSDLVCLLIDSGILQLPSNKRGEFLNSLVKVFITRQSVHISRVIARFVFSRDIVSSGDQSDEVYWSLINQLKLIGDYNLMDLGMGRSGFKQFIFFDSALYSDKVLAICVSLADFDGTVYKLSSTDASDLVAAMHANVPVDVPALNKFILSIEALADSGKYVSSVLVPAIQIAQLLPETHELYDALLSSILRMTDSISIENFSEWEMATFVDIRMHACMRINSHSSLVVPPWMPPLLATDSQAVIQSILGFFVFVATETMYLDPNLIHSIEKAVFKSPTRYSLISWLWILVKSGSIAKSGLERISQLLDNDGEIGELAWWILCQCRDMFAFDDSAVWAKAIDKMASISGAAIYVADSVRISPARAGEIMDMIELHANMHAWNMEILYALSTTEKQGQLTSIISQTEDSWATLAHTRPPHLVLSMVMECTRKNDKLLVYIVHSGLIEKVLADLENPSESLIDLINRVAEISQSLQLNHFDSIMEWIASDKFLLMLKNGFNNNDSYLQYLGFEVCRVASILIRNCCVKTVSWSPRDAFGWIMSEQNFLDSHACAAITEFVRLSSRNESQDLNPRAKKFLIDLMRFHDTVPVPDSVEISSSEGSVLFFSQARLFASVTCSCPELVSEYSRWFSSVWQRSLLIVETKKTSMIPIATELICGLVEVIDRYPKSKCLSQPLSYVLSYATRTGEMSPSLFSLCLSAGEAASLLLVDKPVVGKILRTLVSLHATVHARMIPKSIESISRLGSVVRFASSLIGCKVCVSEVMEILDGWLEAISVIDKQLLTRVVGAMVVAGTVSRTFLATTLKGKVILENLISNSSDLELAILEVIQGTSYKLCRDTSTVCGGA